ncbi:unknown protein [Oryza sativa Japonica Group]|uniref:Uncharacterized protein n=1 Tax=Oryza sativa subsp. japonica TaxID=39947 RepID=Q656D9_ORYSJ|nr:unknown protein [Oryza sativa Japonica Group]
MGSRRGGGGGLSGGEEPSPPPDLAGGEAATAAAGSLTGECATARRPTIWEEEGGREGGKGRTAHPLPQPALLFAAVGISRRGRDVRGWTRRRLLGEGRLSLMCQLHPLWLEESRGEGEGEKREIQREGRRWSSGSTAASSPSAIANGRRGSGPTAATPSPPPDPVGEEIAMASPQLQRPSTQPGSMVTRYLGRVFAVMDRESAWW